MDKATLEKAKSIEKRIQYLQNLNADLARLGVDQHSECKIKGKIDIIDIDAELIPEIIEGAKVAIKEKSESLRKEFAAL